MELLLISLLGWPWRYNGVQCRHKAPVSRMFMVWVSREVSSTILLATWVLLCYAAKRKRSHWVALGITALRQKKKTKTKTKRGFRKRHFKLNISNSFILADTELPLSTRIPLSQYRTFCHLLSCSRQNAKNILILFYLSSAPPYWKTSKYCTSSSCKACPSSPAGICTTVASLWSSHPLPLHWMTAETHN